MCSILQIVRLRPGLSTLRREALERWQRQRHRGPDWSDLHVDESAILLRERLANFDPEGGSQPLPSADDGPVLAVSGEIYNHRELKRDLQQPYRFLTS